jgi:PII-like signaling protein
MAGNTITVTMVRLYLSEGDHRLRQLMEQLHDQEKVRGVTVFRGVSGFGTSGEIHSSALLDISLDLPLVVEFFDEPEKVKRILDHLSDSFKPGHMVSWTAQINN